MDFLKELEKHVNKWVASPAYAAMMRYCASGDSIIEARQKAESQGFKDATFFKVHPPTAFHSLVDVRRIAILLQTFHDTAEN